MKLVLCAVAAAASASLSPLSGAGAVRSLEFIADQPPTHSSHASTVIESPEGLLSAWFGGTDEGNPDVGIWMSRLQGGHWTAPVEIARGDEETDGRTYACFNPVFFQDGIGPLYLSYKVGPRPDSWWGRIKVSRDNGRTWSKSERLPTGIIGPVRNKPILRSTGVWLCGASDESAGWRVHMERTRDPMGFWHRTEDLNNPMDMGAIQPTLLPWPDGRIQILARTKQGVIAESWSEDGGATWPKLKRLSFPNPNSAIDGVVLKQGYAVLACNPSSTSREMLALARSKNGKDWETVVELERGTGEFSYPAVIQSVDGLIHITFTWKRQKIRHAVVDPALFPAFAQEPSSVGKPKR